LGTDFTIKMAFPLYFNLLTGSDYSFDSRHRLFTGCPYTRF